MVVLTRLNSSSAHHEPVYEGTPTDYCKDQAVKRCLLCPGGAILEQTSSTSSLGTLRFYLLKQLDRHWFEIFPAAPV